MLLPRCFLRLNFSSIAFSREPCSLQNILLSFSSDTININAVSLGASAVPISVYATAPSPSQQCLTALCSLLQHCVRYRLPLLENLCLSQHSLIYGLVSPKDYDAPPTTSALKFSLRCRYRAYSASASFVSVRRALALERERVI